MQLKGVAKGEMTFWIESYHENKPSLLKREKHNRYPQVAPVGIYFISPVEHGMKRSMSFDNVPSTGNKRLL